MQPSIDKRDLPAAHRSGHDLKSLKTPGDFRSFLQDDLNVERINVIARHLWLVGKRYPPRALNIQLVLERKIIPTTEATLHLVWTSQKIFIEPLPSYLLSHAFYSAHISPQCTTFLCPPALGLLHTYVALLPTALDFELAQSEHLIPKSYDWETWKSLASRFLDDYPDDTVYRHVPERYKYGELRLSRLDKIYRWLCADFLHGYSTLTGSTRYVDYFAKNWATFAAITVYFAVTMSAMSLGRNTKPLKENEMFDRVCYGFAVFAMLLPILAVGLLVGCFTFMFNANLVKTLIVKRERSAQVDGTSTRGYDEGMPGKQLV